VTAPKYPPPPTRREMLDRQAETERAIRAGEVTVTICPPAYAGIVQGGTPKSVPVYDETAEKERAKRAYLFWLHRRRRKNR